MPSLFTAVESKFEAFMIHLDRSVVAVDGKEVVPPRLLAAAPAPLRGATTLSFTLSNEAEGSPTVHDATGRVRERTKLVALN